LIGALLVLLVLREVFHTLFHPSGRPQATMAIFRGVWKLTGMLGERARSLSGPLSMVLVIASWVAGMVVGWALIYWPAMPESFVYSDSLSPKTQDGILDAIYYSWVTQTTLGYGTIAPAEDITRILGPLQATMGFAILTLVVTWVLSVYPALQRQRSTATLAGVIEAAHAGIGVTGPAQRPTAARQMAKALSTFRVDLTQYPSTFFFAAPNPSMAMSKRLPFIVRLAADGEETEETRGASAALQASLDLFAEALAQQRGMPSAGRDEVFSAYQRHHES
jgi:ABC-type thiamin/hydroxymethylpyrimidine transport system permease subunit